MTKRQRQEARLAALRRILNYQFDLELLQKHRELKLLELEVDRGAEIRVCLEKLMINEAVYPDRYSRAEFALPLSPHQALSAYGSGALRRAASMPGLGQAQQQQQAAAYQYEMRADGTVVKLACPVCGAERFKSMLGFLNHCRIHCHVQFTSPEDRQLRAGVPVDPSLVPADFFSRHPTVIKQEQELAVIRSDLQPIFEQQQQVLSPEPLSKSSFLGQEPQPVLEEKLLKEAEPLIGEMTRFCVHKRVVLGNTAKCLPSSEAVSKQYTHQWRLYVRAPPPNASGQRDVLGRWVRSVRFFLHPSYPDNVVDVLQEPFELVRDAYGEFPVRVQLHFWDVSRNPPFDIIHHVKIFQATFPGRTTAGPERLYEIELDRSTDFSLSLTGIPSQPPSAPEQGQRSNSQLSDYDILSSGLGKARAIDLGISAAADQKSVERAKLAHCETLREQLLLRTAMFCLSAEEILLWLAANRRDYFAVDVAAASVESTADATEAENQGSGKDDGHPKRFCCYCGQPHGPAHRFDVLQKNCSYKPRKVRLSSRTDLSSFVVGRYSIADGPLPDEQSRYAGAFSPKPTKPDSFTIEQELVEHYSEYPDIFKSLVETPHEERMTYESRFMMNLLTGIFAKRLVARSIATASEVAGSKQSVSPLAGGASTSAMLTPLHVYHALAGDQHLVDNPMDFITLENMQA